MSLSSAYHGAIAGLTAASTQIALVSRNIANQSNPSATRKISNLVTINGLPNVASGLARVEQRSAWQSPVGELRQSPAIGHLGRANPAAIHAWTSANLNPDSPISLLGALQDALQTYAAAPRTPPARQAAVIAAQNLANGLE